MKRHAKKSKLPTTLEQRNMLGDRLGFAGAEAYKLLRTNLLFTLPGVQTCYTVGVTSALRGEGKSTTAVNLAYALAETEKSVLLVEADMRLPVLAKRLGAAPAPGLSNLLAGLCETEEAIQVSFLRDNLWLIAAGDIPPNPSELLASETMLAVLSQLQERFDMIILDLPPIDLVSDGLALAKVISGFVVVVRQDYSDYQSVAATMRQLSFAEAKVLGFVFTDAEHSAKDYQYKKYSRQYGQPYGYGGGRTRSGGAHSAGQSKHLAATPGQETDTTRPAGPASAEQSAESTEPAAMP